MGGGDGACGVWLPLLVLWLKMVWRSSVDVEVLPRFARLDKAENWVWILDRIVSPSFADLQNYYK
jgi:hypothetical protein